MHKVKSEFVGYTNATAINECGPSQTDSTADHYDVTSMQQQLKAQNQLLVQQGQLLAAQGQMLSEFKEEQKSLRSRLKWLEESVRNQQIPRRQQAAKGSRETAHMQYFNSLMG